MKFSDYLKSNIISKGKIQIVPTRTKDILENIKEKDVLDKINTLLTEANKKLKRDFPSYTQMKYKFVVDEENKLDEMNIDEEKKEKLKKRWLTLNSELAKIQMDWEEKN